MFNDFFKWFLLGLKPPTLPVGREPTEDELCKYRKQNDRQKHAIAYTLWAVIFCFLTFFFWSRNQLTDWVGPGFAYAADVEKKADELNDKVDKVAHSLDQLLRSQLRSDLREARRLHCLAKKEGNTVLVSKYAEDLDELQEQFFAIYGRQWNQPRCEDI